jgi:hypothetical protein
MKKTPYQHLSSIPHANLIPACKLRMINRFNPQISNQMSYYSILVGFIHYFYQYTKFYISRWSWVSTVALCHSATRVKVREAYHEVKAKAKLKLSLRLIKHYMSVISSWRQGAKLHAPADLAPGKYPSAPTGSGVGWAPQSAWSLWRRYTFLLSRKWNLDLAVFQLVV